MRDHYSDIFTDRTDLFDEYNNAVIDPNAHLLPPANINEACEIIILAPDGAYYKYMIRKSIRLMLIGLMVNLTILSTIIIYSWIAYHKVNPVVCGSIEVVLFLGLFFFNVPLIVNLSARHEVRADKYFDKKSDEEIIAIATSHVEDSNKYLEKCAAKKEQQELRASKRKKRD